MTDAKLDPKTLTAVVRENYPPPPPMAGWLGFYYDSDSDNGGAGWYCSGKVHADREDALCELASFLPFEGSALVEVGQAGALFGQSESEAKATREVNRLPKPTATDVFATDRAIGVQAMNAEDVPAATEMPEAVRKVCHRLRHLAMTSAIACRIGDRDEFDEYADALESWWRTHAAQPVKAPRPKLEKTRRALKCGQERLNIVFLSEETTTRWNNLFYEALAELDEWEGR